MRTLKQLISNCSLRINVLTCLFDQRRLLINKITSRFLVAIHQRLFEQSACMISRFNEIIPFDRPLSSTSSVPPWPSFGILWHPQRETLEPERFNCEPRSDLIVSARSASVPPRSRGKRKKMLLKKSPKNPGGHAFWFREKDVYACAYSSKSLPSCLFLSIPLPLL